MDVSREGGPQVDLTPFNQVPPAARVRARRTGRRRWGAVVALVAVVAVGAGILLQGLGNATLYFRFADEAVAEREELGSRRFRLQGAVVPGSIERQGDEVRFLVEHGGVEVPVAHQGDPPDLFQGGIPVVLEGRFEGEAFGSDRIMVRHTEEYSEENPDRVAEPSP